MKTYLTALPTVLIATPGLAHHEDAGVGPSGLLHSPLSMVALAALVLITAYAARRLRPATSRDDRQKRLAQNAGDRSAKAISLTRRLSIEGSDLRRRPRRKYCTGHHVLTT